MGFLSRMLFGKPPRRIEHPVFGEALLMPAKYGSYWEVETEVAGQPFTIAIETTDEQEPSRAQVDFFNRYANNSDLAFRRAALLLVPEYEKWVREPFPDSWREAFKFTSMSIPVAGDEQNPWDLSFECIKDRDGHLFTCSFRNGAAVELQVDG